MAHLPPKFPGPRGGPAVGELLEFELALKLQNLKGKGPFEKMLQIPEIQNAPNARELLEFLDSTFTTMIL